MYIWSNFKLKFTKNTLTTDILIIKKQTVIQLNTFDSKQIKPEWKLQDSTKFQTQQLSSILTCE